MAWSGLHQVVPSPRGRGSLRGRVFLTKTFVPKARMSQRGNPSPRLHRHALEAVDVCASSGTHIHRLSPAVCLFSVRE